MTITFRSLKPFRTSPTFTGTPSRSILRHNYPAEQKAPLPRAVGGGAAVEYRNHGALSENESSRESTQYFIRTSGPARQGSSQHLRSCCLGCRLRIEARRPHVRIRLPRPPRASASIPSPTPLELYWPWPWDVYSRSSCQAPRCTAATRARRTSRPTTRFFQK